jgi:hypothetical protein
MNRIADAAEWLAAEISTDRDEFRSAHKRGADQVLEGLMAKGYAAERKGRIVLTDAGRRMVHAERPVE